MPLRNDKETVSKQTCEKIIPEMQRHEWKQHSETGWHLKELSTELRISGYSMKGTKFKRTSSKVRWSKLEESGGPAFLS